MAGVVAWNEPLAAPKVFVVFTLNSGLRPLDEKKSKGFVPADWPFYMIHRHIRKHLDLPPDQALFVFVSKFQPSLDDRIGDLWRVFGVQSAKGRELCVTYAASPAWG
eukprot:TRINITY_DN49032_c0_g1_i1.p1 TRINITY_DN49032_c0_g1~~TRINITY_DN49032_c0_g1_i1.p1  ORF type:complete len:107 (+),score=7.46 TRINITY_DN49032_c0_g1_i1:161-481(+)